MGLDERPSLEGVAHPVVVVSLLQRSAEVEAATGHACISGTLDVPAEAASVAVTATQHSVPNPTLTPGFQYLALLGTSGLVLSITTCFPCLSAAWHELTQRCHDPSVS